MHGRVGGTAFVSAPRTLTLCADDFGLTPGISSGISALAHARRLSWVSCIANADHWKAGAALAAHWPGSVELGLHINLTEGRPLSAALAKLWPELPTLPILIARAHLGLLPLTAVRQEIEAQLAAFRVSAGGVPRFLDGHQHVHHLPGVREIVLELAAGIDPRPAVRNTAHILGPGFQFKRWIIAASGGRGLQRELLRGKFAHNTCLLGVYDFRNRNYGHLMRDWLARLPVHGGMLYCHPAQSDDGPADPTAPARLREYAYLSGDQFLEDLAQANVTLAAADRTPNNAVQEPQPKVQTRFAL